MVFRNETLFKYYILVKKQIKHILLTKNTGVIREFGC